MPSLLMIHKPSVSRSSGDSSGCRDLAYGQWHVHVRETWDSENAIGRIVVFVSNYCGTNFSYSYSKRHHHIRENWTWRWWLTQVKPRKMDRAVAAAWRWCDRQNALEAVVRAAVEGATGS